MSVALRILRFSTDHCQFCKVQKRALIVERFKDGRPSTQLIELVCAADEEELKDESKKKAYELSESYDVQSFPTLIVEAKLDGGAAVELCRFEGPVTLKQLEKTFAEAEGELVANHLPWS